MLALLACRAAGRSNSAVRTAVTCWRSVAASAGRLAVAGPSTSGAAVGPRAAAALPSAGSPLACSAFARAASTNAHSPTTPSTQALARLAASRPASLATPADDAAPPSSSSSSSSDITDSPPGPLRRALLTLGGYYSAESRAIRAAKGWLAAVVRAAAGPGAPLARAAGLDPARFADTHALLCLHVWLALVRLRAEGPAGKALAQALYEGFADEVEARVRAAGVRVRVGKWLAELERMFYGAATAYDRAIGAVGGGGEAGGKGAAAPAPAPAPGTGEAALAAALLRNAYGGDAARAPDAASLARYALRELACLGLTDSDAVLAGHVGFSAERLGGGGGGGEAVVADAGRRGGGEGRGEEAA